MARMPRMARTPRMARWLADYPDPDVGVMWTPMETQTVARSGFSPFVA